MVQTDAGHGSAPSPGWTYIAVIFLFLYELVAFNVVFLGIGLSPGAGILEQAEPQTSIHGRACAFNVAWVMAFWSYLRAHFTEPGFLNDAWRAFVQNTPDLNVCDVGRSSTWCPGVATTTARSSEVRPERAHYCVSCGADVLRMDHYCPLIGNCIGFRNHKFFLQLGFYASVAGVVGLISMGPECAICFLEEPDLEDNLWVFKTRAASQEAASSSLPRWCAENSIFNEIFLTSSASMIFCLLITSGLFLSHFPLACQNMTSIEANYTDVPNPYDQGSCFSNLAQVMGQFGWDWFLPVEPRRPLSDGFSYKRADEVLPRNLLATRGNLPTTTFGIACLLEELPVEALWRYRYNCRNLESGSLSSLPAW